MCKSQAQGGHRCTGTAAGRALYSLYRERKASPERWDELTAIITNVKQARDVYGDFVSPMSMSLDGGVLNAIDVAQSVGTPLVVGGAVRDAALGAESKDTDIEVFRTTLEDLTRAFRSRGFHVDEVGREFGVLKVSKKGVVSDLDVAVPRRENQTGRGHRDFAVDTGSDMSITDAASRRDFTINAMSYDPQLGVVVDPYGGAQDARDKTLRAVSDKFGEDPLRVLRGFQFAARFGMTMDTRTAVTCRKLLPHFDELSKERVQEEWSKFFTKGTDMLKGVRTLQDVRWDYTLPGLRVSLLSTNVVDALCKIPSMRKSERAVLGSAVIMSGMKKQSDRTEFGDNVLVGKDARRMAQDLVQTASEDLSSTYLQKKYMKDKASRGFTWDRYRSFAEITGDAEGIRIAESAIAAGVGTSPEPPLVQGRDIVTMTSRKPGPWVGEIVDEALDRQYQGLLSDKSSAVDWVRARLEV